MNVVNIPRGDARMGDFCADLIEFIRDKGDGLPYAGIIGAIEIAKLEIMNTQQDIVLGA